MSNFSLFPMLVPDRNAINVCSTAGIELMSNKRVRLVQLRRSLQSSIAEIEKASKKDDLISRALLTANLVKATCEAFLEMAGAIGDAAGIKNVDLVAKAGSAAISFADSSASTVVGSKTDWISTTNKLMGAAGAKYIKTESIKDLADLQTIKVEILNSAVRGESAKMLQSVFLSYVPKIAEMSLKYMKQETAAKWTNAVMTVSNSGYSYSKALEETFNTRINDREEFNSRKSSLLTTTYRQIGQIMKQIDVVDGIMRQCASAVPLGRLT